MIDLEFVEFSYFDEIVVKKRDRFCMCALTWTLKKVAGELGVGVSEPVAAKSGKIGAIGGMLSIFARVPRQKLQEQEVKFIFHSTPGRFCGLKYLNDKAIETLYSR